jgi:hypothetical protein
VGEPPFSTGTGTGLARGFFFFVFSEIKTGDHRWLNAFYIENKTFKGGNCILRGYVIQKSRKWNYMCHDFMVV